MSQGYSLYTHFPPVSKAKRGEFRQSVARAFGDKPALEGSISVSIIVNPPSEFSAEIAHVIDAVIDAIKLAGVIGPGARIDAISMERGLHRPGGGVLIRAQVGRQERTDWRNAA